MGSIASWASFVLVVMACSDASCYGCIEADVLLLCTDEVPA